jgi:hypothetical protein
LFQYASGWPKGVETDEQKQEFVDRYKKKEGITLDKNKFEKNAGKRQSAKLMLNALVSFFFQLSCILNTIFH